MCSDRKAKTVHNDIGLIRLPQVAEINPGVRPVCLPLSSAGTEFEAPGNVATVVGWGFNSQVVSFDKYFLSRSIAKCHWGQ